MSSEVLTKIIGSLLFWLAVGGQHVVWAQNSSSVQTEYEVYTVGYGAIHGTTPFWHHANTYGRISSRSRANSLTGIRGKIPYQTWGGFRIAAGTELTVRVSDIENTVHFTQLYAALRYQALRLRIGRFGHETGLHDERLSTGSMLVSGNATPTPKIELSTPGYIAVPLSDGNLQLKVHWSEGRLEENRYISRAWIHQKSLHFRVPIGTSLGIIGGATQSIQWGGISPNGEKMVGSVQEYLDFVLNRNGGVEENTVASFDFAATLSYRDWGLQAYREIYLEDMFLLRSAWDGLWGISLRNRSNACSTRWIDGVQYEFMNTIQQDALPGLPRGRAGYYTHSSYRSGWTYHNNVIGNPLIRNPQFRALGGFQTRSDLEGVEVKPNTMVIAHHLGIEGRPVARFKYEARLTYSRNYGVCQNQIISGECGIGTGGIVPPDLETIPRSQLRQDQYATMLNVRYLLSEAYGMRLRSSVAVDWGEFDGTQIGVMLGLQWDGTVSL